MLYSRSRLGKVLAVAVLGLAVDQQQFLAPNTDSGTDIEVKVITRIGADPALREVSKTFPKKTDMFSVYEWAEQNVHYRVKPVIPKNTVVPLGQISMSNFRRAFTLVPENRGAEAYPQLTPEDEVPLLSGYVPSNANAVTFEVDESTNGLAWQLRWEKDGPAYGRFPTPFETAANEVKFNQIMEQTAAAVEKVECPTLTAMLHNIGAKNANELIDKKVVLSRYAEERTESVKWLLEFTTGKKDVADDDIQFKKVMDETGALADALFEAAYRMPGQRGNGLHSTSQAWVSANTNIRYSTAPVISWSIMSLMNGAGLLPSIAIPLQGLQEEWALLEYRNLSVSKYHVDMPLTNGAESMTPYFLDSEAKEEEDSADEGTNQADQVADSTTDHLTFVRGYFPALHADSKFTGAPKKDGNAYQGEDELDPVFAHPRLCFPEENA